MPIDNDEISLKRVWSIEGKDLYYLNNKSLSKNELNNLLECCGLSRSNPYNVI